MSLGSIFTNAKDNVEGAIAKLTKNKVTTGVKEVVKVGAKAALGASSIAGKATKEKVCELTDNIAGTAVQVRIEAMILEQRRYNDILATQLSLALDRIEKLERIFTKLSK